MSLLNRRIDAFTNPVGALDTIPKMDVDDLKKRFDSNSEEARTAINGIIDDLGSEQGSSYIGAQAIAQYLGGVPGETVRAQIEFLAQYLNTHSTAEVLTHPDGSVTASKIAANAVSDGNIGSREIDDPAADSGKATGLLTNLFNAVTTAVRALRSAKADRTEIYSKTEVDSKLSAKVGDAPAGGELYMRRNGAWQQPAPVGLTAIVVAAANSSLYDKGRADYICTTAGDQFVIAQAIAKLAGGGTVCLCGGDYYFSLQSGPLLELGSNITLKGVYGKTVIHTPEYVEGCGTTCAVSMGSGCVMDGLSLVYSAEYVAYDMVGYSPVIAIGDNIVIKNTNISDFASDLIVGSDAAYHSNFVMDNVTTWLADSIKLIKINKTTIQNCSIATSWVRDWHMGIVASYCDDFEVFNTKLNFSWGPAIAFSGSKAKISDNVIVGTLELDGHDMKIYDNEVSAYYEGRITGTSNKIHDNNIAFTNQGQTFYVTGEKIHFHNNAVLDTVFCTNCTNSQLNENIFTDCIISVGWKNIITQNFYSNSFIDNDNSSEGYSSNCLENNYSTY